MNVNAKSKEFARFIKSTEEFKQLKKSRDELNKNKSLKRKLDTYVSKKNTLFSRYDYDTASKNLTTLNNDFKDFFALPVVSNYLDSSKKFNSMMETVYKSIEEELLK